MPEMFLKFHDIEGESLDNEHPGEIEIKAWGWKSDAKIDWERNQGGQCTHAKYDCVSIEKTVDKASATLLRCCLTGKHIKHAKITCRKNDGDQKIEYLIIELNDVMVKSVKWAGVGEEGDLPESIEVECAEFVSHYKLQRDEGEASGGSSFGFNIQTQVIR